MPRKRHFINHNNKKMKQLTSNRLSPQQLLNFQYSDTLYCGIDDQGSDVYEKIDSPLAERLPTLVELTELSNDDLIQLARKIARAYKFYLLPASPEEKNLATQELPFSIQVKKSKNTTTDSIALKLSDEKWWRKKIIKLADEKREHLAHQNKVLGGRRPTQTCCTAKTLEMYEQRREATEGFLKSKNRVIRNKDHTFLFNLFEVSESAKKNRANELFLNIKALEKIAERKGFDCVFLTLTAAPEFHPNPKTGNDKYCGASAREANQSLQKDWRSILDALDNLGIQRNSGDYFGFRAVEVHDDGCPHWHIILFFNRDLGIIESIESSIGRLYRGRGNYFERNMKDVIRTIKKTDENTATPSSYIFGYVLKGLASENDETAKKYKCAIRAMGARQYAFFGIKCATGKQRALKKIARNEQAPHHIRLQAAELHLPHDAEDRNKRQLEARIEFFEHGSSVLTLEKERKSNRYGEEYYSTKSIKHRNDDVSVDLTGLSESVSKEVADRLRRSDMHRENKGHNCY